MRVLPRVTLLTETNKCPEIGAIILSPLQAAGQRDRLIFSALLFNHFTSSRRILFINQRRDLQAWFYIRLRFLQCRWQQLTSSPALRCGEGQCAKWYVSISFHIYIRLIRVLARSQQIYGTIGTMISLTQVHITGCSPLAPMSPDPHGLAPSPSALRPL